MRINQGMPQPCLSLIYQQQMVQVDVTYETTTRDCSASISMSNHNLNHETIRKILSEDLSKKTLFAKMVLKNFTLEQKHER